ncbi:MAG: hypothetical protein IK015_04015 [Treponema sp.]|nr:hypothetical protein [Treponema sp.]
MKRTMLAAIALPLVCAILFSCQSTDGAAKKADDASALVAQDVKGEEEAAQNDNAAQEQTAENQNETVAQDQSADQDENAEKIAAEDFSDADQEKIPQSEMNEFSALLNEESADKEKSAEQEKAAASSQNEGAASASQAAQTSGALVNKIKSANKDNARSDDNGKDATSSEGLARVTEQGNTIKGGPLVGPGSDKIPGGEKTAGNSSATNSSNESNESNEAISLNGPQEEQEQEAKEEKPEPVPSRAMTIKNNQFVDIVYPGSGWIYLGEEGAGDHFIFQGRKLGNGETTFILRSKEPGTALLHFYKNDILTGNYIDDFIEISITDKSAADATHVEAPSYAEVVPPKFDRTKAVQEKEVAKAPKEDAPKSQEKAPQSQQKKQEPAKQNEAAESHVDNSPSEKVQTVIQTSGQDKDKGEPKQKTNMAGTTAPAAQEEQKESALQEGFSGGTDKAKSLLERAQKAYDEKRYAEALDLVQQFFDTASEDFDAGLYLEGLILEAKSEVRNIKSAIGAYDTLIKNWPQSNYWRKANERSIYLKRFYIDIR